MHIRGKCDQKFGHAYKTNDYVNAASSWHGLCYSLTIRLWMQMLFSIDWLIVGCLVGGLLKYNCLLTLLCSFLDVRLTNDSDIPTVPFLDACRSGLQFFGEIFTCNLIVQLSEFSSFTAIFWFCWTYFAMIFNKLRHDCTTENLWLSKAKGWPTSVVCCRQTKTAYVKTPLVITRAPSFLR